MDTIEKFFIKSHYRIIYVLEKTEINEINCSDSINAVIQ